MKKLLTLFLVLALTSWASATLTLTIATGASPGSGDYSDAGTEYTMDMGDYIWIGVHNDTQGQSGDTRQFACYLDFASSETDPPAEFTGDGLIYQPPAVPTTEDGPSITFYGYTATSAVDWLKGDMANGVPSNYTGVGTVFGVKFSCLSDDADVVVVLYDDGYSQIDSVTIHQVPEPMTIALLGLGGLFLRRRK